MTLVSDSIAFFQKYCTQKFCIRMIDYFVLLVYHGRYNQLFSTFVTPLSTTQNNYIHSILLAYYVFKLNRRAFQNNYSMVQSFSYLAHSPMLGYAMIGKQVLTQKFFPECWKHCSFWEILLFAFWTYIIPLLCITKKNIRLC